MTRATASTRICAVTAAVYRAMFFVGLVVANSSHVRMPSGVLTVQVTAGADRAWCARPG